MKGALYGHSFVFGFAEHLRGLAKSRPRLSPSKNAAQLRINDVVQSMDLIGERGLRVLQPGYETPLLRIWATALDFVILDIGTNRILNGKPPKEICEKLPKMAETIMLQPSVKLIVICSILKRKSTRHADSSFEENIRELNSLLKIKCKNEANIKFHTHTGFTRPIETWSFDGTHSNRPLGRKLYTRSIRFAAFKTATTIKNKNKNHSQEN